jgi:hypothetical protein
LSLPDPGNAAQVRLRLAKQRACQHLLFAKHAVWRAEPRGGRTNEVLRPAQAATSWCRRSPPQGTVTFHEGFKAVGPQEGAGDALRARLTLDIETARGSCGGLGPRTGHVAPALIACSRPEEEVQMKNVLRRMLIQMRTLSNPQSILLLRVVMERQKIEIHCESCCYMTIIDALSNNAMRTLAPILLTVRWQTQSHISP